MPEDWVQRLAISNSNPAAPGMKKGLEVKMGIKKFSQRMAWLAGVAALALASGACSRSPEAKSARYMAEGKKMMEKKDPARAILQFQNAAQATPKDPEVFYQFALAYLAAGDFQRGVGTLRKALELNPKHREAQLRLAQLMSYSDDPGVLKEAQQRLQAVVADSPQYADALHALALTDFKLGEADDAIELLNRASAAAPQDIMIAVTIAEAQLQKRDAKGAEETLKKMCASSPQSVDAPVILGRFYVSQNRLADADTQFQRALKMDGNNAGALLNLGLLQLRTAHKQEVRNRPSSNCQAFPTRSLRHTTLRSCSRTEGGTRRFANMKNWSKKILTIAPSGLSW